MTTNGSEVSNGSSAVVRAGKSNGHTNDGGTSSDLQGLSSTDSMIQSTNGSSSTNGTGHASNGNSANGFSNGTNGMNGIDDEFASNTFIPLYDGSSLDRREFIRITVQSLRELGLESSAKSLELESGISLEHPSIIGFRAAILSGDWKSAERLLIDGLRYGASKMMARMGPSAPETSRNGALSMASSSSANIDLALRDPLSRGIDWIKFLIYQQRYLELLESKQTRKALSVLRDRLAPLNHGSDTLHQLSSLVICGTSEELCERANWLGSGLASRRKLLEEIETAISPSVMIPSRRLPQLLEQAQQLQKSRDPFFNLPLDTRISLYVDHQSDRSVFPTRTAAILTEHMDEVWHVSFSHDGTKLASVGKDHEVLVWSVGITQSDFQVVNRLGSTTGHICHVSFSPDDVHLLATSDDGEVIVWNLHDGPKQEYKGHTYAVGTGAWMPDGQGFVTGGMDRKVCFWDINLGLQRTWSTGQFRVQAIDVSPDGRYLVAVSHRYVPHSHSATTTGGGTHQSSASTTSRIAAQILGTQWFDYPSPTVHDEEWHMARSHDEHDVIDLGGGSRTMTNERFQLHFYDIRKKEDVGSIYMMEEMTSVSFSDDSKYVLINQRPNEALIWDVQKQSLVHRFTGHRIHQHVIRSCFGGAENSFVISGSEDGSIYVYHRKTGKLLDRLRGHNKGSVNSVAWHPRQHSMFASCGDDGTIRIWRPESAVNNESHGPLQARYESNGNGTSGSVGNGRTNEGNHSHFNQNEGRDREMSNDAAMGPSPFPWPTSPRDPGSPSGGYSRRRARRLAARLAAATASNSVVAGATSTADFEPMGLDREEEEEDDDDEEEDEEGDEDEDEEDDEEEDEDEEDAMEEGGD